VTEQGRQVGDVHVVVTVDIAVPIFEPARVAVVR